MISDWDYSDPATGLFSRERFWLEKVSWSESGDRTPDGENCIRINGHHFVAMPGLIPSQPFMGHGGRIMRWWHVIDGMRTSNNVWHQGEIPEEFRDRLPDNAYWLPVEGARTVADSLAAALERVQE